MSASLREIFERDRAGEAVAAVGSRPMVVRWGRATSAERRVFPLLRGAGPTFDLNAGAARTTASAAWSDQPHSSPAKYAPADDR